MSVKWEMTLDITPVPQSRPRVTRRGIAYTPKRSATFKREFQSIISGRCPKTPLSSPLAAEITFWLPISRTTKRQRAAISGAPHAKRPDIDNLVKAVLDAMNGLVFSDDGLISSLKASKVWGDAGRIRIRLLDATEQGKEDSHA